MAKKKVTPGTTWTNPEQFDWSPWYKVRVMDVDLLGDVTVQPAGPGSERIADQRHKYPKAEFATFTEG